MDMSRANEKAKKKKKERKRREDIEGDLKIAIVDGFLERGGGGGGV